MEINLKFFFGTILTSIVLYQKFFKPSNSQAPTVNAPVGDIKGEQNAIYRKKKIHKNIFAIYLGTYLFTQKGSWLKIVKARCSEKAI